MTLIRGSPKSVPSRIAARKRSPDQINRDDQYVRDEGDGQNELAKLPGAPCAFEIFACVEQGCAVQEDGENVLLDKGRGEERPGIVVEHGRHQSQIGHDRAFLGTAGRDIQLSPSGDIVQKGKGQLADQQNARGGRDIDANRHGGQNRSKRREGSEEKQCDAMRLGARGRRKTVVTTESLEVEGAARETVLRTIRTGGGGEADGGLRQPPARPAPDWLVLWLRTMLMLNQLLLNYVFVSLAE